MKPVLAWSRAVAGLLLVFAVAASAPVRAGTEPVRVFAAASLKNALDAVAAKWSEENPGKTVKSTYAASSALAKQIAEAAPADIFFSADEAWMDDLAGKGLLRDDSRIDLLGNGLVLIAPKDSTVSVDFSKSVDLVALLNGGRLALANVQAVPAGKYAKAALENLGLWSSVEEHVAQAENVRAALAFVARGEAPLGIVYESDAKVERNVRVAGVIPHTSHPAVVYPAAIVETSGNPDAKALLVYFASPEAQALFASFGFRPLRN